MADKDGFDKRVPQAFAVVDAILKGHLPPDPSPEEQAELGLADFDPELRYRVARDILEQAYGKPKQQMEVTGEVHHANLLVPAWFNADQIPAPKATAGEPGPLELESGDDE